MIKSEGKLRQSNKKLNVLLDILFPNPDNFQSIDIARQYELMAE